MSFTGPGFACAPAGSRVKPNPGFTHRYSDEVVSLNRDERMRWSASPPRARGESRQEPRSHSRIDNIYLRMELAQGPNRLKSMLDLSQNLRQFLAYPRFHAVFSVSFQSFQLLHNFRSNVRAKFCSFCPFDC